MFLSMLSCCTNILCSSGSGHDLLNWPTANDRMKCHISSLVSTDLFTSHWEQKSWYEYEIQDMDTRFKQQSPSCEATSSPANQKILCILHYFVHNSPPFPSILNHTNPVHTTHTTQTQYKLLITLTACGEQYKLLITLTACSEQYKLLITLTTCGQQYSAAPSADS
jgi:hypothetical protein